MGTYTRSKPSQTTMHESRVKNTSREETDLKTTTALLETISLAFFIAIFNPRFAFLGFSGMLGEEANQSALSKRSCRLLSSVNYMKRLFSISAVDFETYIFFWWGLIKIKNKYFRSFLFKKVAKQNQIFL